MKKQTVNIREVARRAEVSVGTVSRVINGHDNIGEENFRRVREAMAQLNYPFATAGRRSVGVSQRTGNIGVLLTGMGPAWMDHPLLMAYASGVEAACREHQYHPLLEFVDEGGDGQPRFLAERKVDGLLLKGATPPPAWLANLSHGLPVVGMAMHEPGLAIPQVMPDNRAAGWQVAEYLWNRGHRRIAFVSTEARHRMFLHRLQGVQEFLRLQGSYDPSLMVVEDAVERAPGASRPEESLPNMDRYAERLMSLPPERRPSAIIAANDWSAAGLFLSRERRGVRVPDDVSLTGFDNATAVCCAMRAPLTSYEVPVRQTGYVAAKILLSQIESPDAYVSASIQLISGRLVERDSVATVAAATEPLEAIAGSPA